MLSTAPSDNSSSTVIEEPTELSPPDEMAGVDDPLSSLNRVAELEAELQQKEQLVDALTDRLERAAEELDRWRSSPKSPVDAPSDTSAEADGASLSDWLGKTIAPPAEVGESCSIQDLSVQIAELRDLIQGRLLAAGAADHQPADQLQPADQYQSTDDDPGPGSLLKSLGILVAEDADADNQPLDHAPADRPSAGSAATGDSASQHEQVVAADVNAIDPPEPVGFDTEDPQELHDAVSARDAYISHLLQRMRTANGWTQVPDDWKSLEKVPEELRLRLEELERQLQEKLRFTSVYLSVERARLGREDASLKQQAERLERRLKRLGMNSAAEVTADVEPAPATAAATSSNKWFRFLNNVPPRKAARGG